MKQPFLLQHWLLGLFLLATCLPQAQAQQRGDAADWRTDSLKVDSLMATHPLTPAQAATQPLGMVEKQLARMGQDILNHPNLPYRLALNERFLACLEATLQRKASYTYPFDSLLTVSRIAPPDDSFRIFTWQINNWDEQRTYNEHAYYGIVQRKRYTEKKRLFGIGNRKRAYTLDTYILQDRMDYTRQVETELLDQTKWLGALYYHPRHTEHGVLQYDGKVYRTDARGRIRKQDERYYVLLGWNGHNLSSEYKIIDVLNFDPEDTSKVVFGSPIFYFGSSPKTRAVFKYADRSPFSLNKGFFVDQGNNKKVEAIIFDHLAKANKTNKQRMWDVGADGSYDALYFMDAPFDNKKGFFYFLKNVAVWEPAIEQYDPADIERQAREARKELQDSGLLPPDAETNEEEAATTDGKTRRKNRR